MKLSEGRIEKLKHDRRRRYALSDGGGLQLVVLPGGRKSWVIRYSLAGQARSLKLGTWPAVKLAAARKLAARARTSVELGADPAAATNRRSMTVREFGEKWLEDVVRKVRKDPQPVERMLATRVYPRLGKWPMARVEKDQVRELVFGLRDQGKPAAAAALRHLLKRLFDYAEACGAAPGNPVRSLPLKFVTTRRARQRALNERELKAFLQRLPALAHLGWALELMLLTLCRKSELRLARWEHVDFARHEWEIPAEHSKTGAPHIVYLSRQAEQLLARLKGAAGRAEMVLPKRDALYQPMDPATLNKAVRRVKWGIAHFTPHDLRRTGSTILNEQGYRADVIEKALNHAKPGVRGVYNRAEYRDERRQMLQAWADYLEGLKT